MPLLIRLVLTITLTLPTWLIAQVQSNTSYQKTTLPIRLEKLTPKEQETIRKMNDSDTSSYLVDTRPVLFQIQGIENDQDQVRYTQMIHRPVEVMIYCLGEATDSTLVDHGWIENADGEIIWEMTYADSEPADADARNRKVIDYITIPPGQYRLRYRSDSKHANGDWQGTPPEYEFYYGITVFNLNAIKQFNKKR